MKASTLVLVIGLGAVAAGGFWVWRVVRHARLDLVSLHVREAPLSDVLARIRRQTQEAIVADRRFMAAPEVRVSLDLSAVPLSEALAAIAEQAGGFWRATHTVHDKSAAVDRLADLLRTGTDPTGAGWTNLTGGLPPGFPDGLSGGPVPGTDGPHIEALPADFVPPGPGGPSESGGFAVDEDVRVVSRGPVAVPTINRGVIVRGVAPGTESGESRLQTFDLSPERLLMEEGLVSRIGDRNALDGVGATAAEAARLARAVQGRWATLYSIERLPIPRIASEPGFRAVPRLTWQGGPGPKGGIEGVRGPADLAARAERDMRQNQYDRLERLTPEQRARQAADARSALRPEFQLEEAQ